MKKYFLPLILILLCLLSVSIKGQILASDDLLNIAKQAPNSPETEIYDIFEFFEEKTDDKRELVMLFVHWITLNISYDVERFLSDDDTYTNVSHTLETRQTMCHGYSELLCELCELAEIDCESIAGYAKGYDYKGKPFKEINHIWNAILIDGNWELVDATWASGVMVRKFFKPAFEKKFREQYVFPDPKTFIFTHLPEDPEWQLLDEPISEEEFYSKAFDNKWCELNTVNE